jgi:hypothetical protein
MELLRLGLKPRLYWGFGVLIVMGLGLAAFAASELSGIKTGVQTLSAINDKTIRAIQVSDRIEIIRRANLRYMIDADDLSMKDAAAAESSATDLLRAAAAATFVEDRRVIYTDLIRDVESLRSKRNRLMSLGQQMRADRAKLFAVGDELSANTQRLLDSRIGISDSSIAALTIPIESSVLLVRVANWRFLATRDPKGPATFKANSDSAIAAIAALENALVPDSVRALIGSVKANLTDYIAHFDSLAANMVKSDDLFWKDVTTQTVDMLERIDKAEASLTQSSDATKPISISRFPCRRSSAVSPCYSACWSPISSAAASSNRSPG